jgi:hypothetical protein
VTEHKKREGAELKSLRSGLEKARKEIDSLTEALAESGRREDRANGKLQHALALLGAFELAQIGLNGENTAIQQIEEYRTETEAREALPALLRQDGVLGGRVLPPKSGARGWCVQLFWETAGLPSAHAFFGILNPALPDGMRYCIIPTGQRRALGIKEQ